MIEDPPAAATAETWRSAVESKAEVKSAVQLSLVAADSSKLSIELSAADMRTILEHATTAYLAADTAAFTQADLDRLVAAELEALITPRLLAQLPPTAAGQPPTIQLDLGMIATNVISIADINKLADLRRASIRPVRQYLDAASVSGRRPEATVPTFQQLAAITAAAALRWPETDFSGVRVALVRQP